jgi:glycosyltransferase involved in cell wall biosynthesis
VIVSVVIPTMDEREAIADVVRATQRALRDYSHEIIVIDNSKDQTPAIAAHAGARVIPQKHPGGVGAAFKEAFSQAKGEIVVTLDGDGSYDPTDIPALIDPIVRGEIDFVNGNRLNGRRKRNSMTRLNMVGNRILTWMANVSFGSRVKDTQSGMKAVRRTFLDRMSLFERGFPICTELVGEAVRTGARMTEISIGYYERKGQTKLSPGIDGPRIFWATLSLMRDHKPLLLFGGLGLALIGFGGLTSQPVLAEYLERGTFRFVGRALITSILAVAGTLSIFAGVILDTMNYSIRRLEARIIGLRTHAGVSTEITTLRASAAPQAEADMMYSLALASAETTPMPAPAIRIRDTISIRSAVSAVLREAGFIVRSPAILRGESGIEYNFDVVASQGHETWVFDICADDTTSGTSAVFELFAKILDVKLAKATLLAIPRIDRKAEKLAEIYRIQVIGGSSPAQIRDVLRVLTTGQAGTTLETYAPEKSAQD